MHGFLAGTPRRPSAWAGRTPIYTFDPRADALLREMFPRRVRMSGLTNAYLARGQKPHFDDLDAVLEYNSLSINHARTGTSWVEVGEDNLESAWLGVAREEGWQRPLLQRANRVAGLATGLARPARPFASPLEKALFQRDVLQAGMIFQEAVGAEKDPQTREAGGRALKALASLWGHLLLTEAEYRTLVKIRPRQADPGHFTTTNRFDLSRDYLPGRVLADEPGWYALPYTTRASEHFEHYAGRSFVRVYLKPAGQTRAQFYRYWDDVAAQFGTNITRDGRVPPLPAGTETLLVRSFAVFLADGSCADSGFPEEILMRLFKYDETRLDPATSDYRGTLFYRYRMQRRPLLAQVQSLGLRRVQDEDRQFYGFLSEVPDHRAAYSAHLTTLRSNCIGCHSETFYGANTVYSLGISRPVGEEREGLEGGLLRPGPAPGRFWLRTPEFLAWQRHLPPARKQLP
jgi:hypothetical protein